MKRPTPTGEVLSAGSPPELPFLADADLQAIGLSERQLAQHLIEREQVLANRADLIQAYTSRSRDVDEAAAVVDGLLVAIDARNAQLSASGRGQVATMSTRSHPKDVKVQTASPSDTSQKIKAPKPRFFTRQPKPAPSSAAIKVTPAREASAPNREEAAQPVTSAKSESASAERIFKYKIDSTSLTKEGPYHDINEDSVVCDNSLRLFAVFDGLGGVDNGDVASQIAKDVIAEAYGRYEASPSTIEEALARAKYVMNYARAWVRLQGKGGMTTAVIAKLEEFGGKPYLVWANAGDSRLFVGNRGGEFEAVSTDQSMGNSVQNCLGGDLKSTKDEFGYKELSPGDIVMLCSDGITGDWEHQFLSEAEMRDGFSQANPSAIARKFMELSKKNDDKSVVVVKILADNATSSSSPEPVAASEEDPSPESYPYESPEFRRDKIISITDEYGVRWEFIGNNLFKIENGTTKSEIQATYADGEALPKIREGEPLVIAGKTIDGRDLTVSSGSIVRIDTRDRDVAKPVVSAVPTSGDLVANRPASEPEAGKAEAEASKKVDKTWHRRLRAAMTITQLGHEKAASPEVKDSSEAKKRFWARRRFIATSVAGVLAFGGIFGTVDALDSGKSSHPSPTPARLATPTPANSPAKRPNVDQFKVPKLHYGKGSASIKLSQ